MAVKLYERVQEIWHSKPINTKLITERLQNSGLLDLTIPTQELTIQGEEKGETSLQSQIEIPPKQN